VKFTQQQPTAEMISHKIQLITESINNDYFEFNDEALPERNQKVPG